MPEDPVLESAEFRQYLEELWERLPRYGRLSQVIKPDAPSSIEQLGRIGVYWRQQREAAGLSRYELATISGVHINRLRFFEVGLALEEQERDALSILYANALGRPEMYVEFLKEFGLEPPGPVLVESTIMPPADGNRVLVANTRADLEWRIAHWNFFVQAHTATMTPEGRDIYRREYPVILSLEKAA